jgi:hypothetical protein
VTVPSIRGSIFQSILDHLGEVLERSEAVREEFESQLTADDLVVLESKIGPATWVPIDTYRRVVDFLVALEAEGDPEGYLFRGGWRVAERLHELGLYSQFDASIEKWGTRVGKLIVTLGPVMYNFGEWAFEFAPGLLPAFRVTVRNASKLPECGRFAAVGFVEYLARSATGLAIRVTSERLPEGDIVFTGNMI